jgi:hypothetical protein
MMTVSMTHWGMRLHTVTRLGTLQPGYTGACIRMFDRTHIASNTQLLTQQHCIHHSMLVRTLQVPYK